jgi:hypothetical protein
MLLPLVDLRPSQKLRYTVRFNLFHGLLLFESLSLMHISIALGIKYILKVLCLLTYINVHDN